ncbi:MAG: DUF1499 domain-containing protein [Endomicrobiales bacterium]|jgi:uncharacterized protein (DUF1499 family)
MKIIIFFIMAGLALYLAMFSYLSVDSRKVREIGLVNDRLRTCPGTPNCVVSEGVEKNSQWYIEPFSFNGDPGEQWAKLKAAVIRIGGHIEQEHELYMWATFRSRFWHFVDDLEVRLDTKNKLIDVRSASRVGKGDLGMNRERVEKLRSAFSET